MIPIGFILLLAAAEPLESELITQVGDKEVFAPAFRGVWSTSLETCADEQSLETFEITETKLYGYEWDSVLLKSTPMIGQSGPARGQWAHTVVVLTAERTETDVSMGKRRMSLMDGKLYMSIAEVAPEETHLSAAHANVRCPRR
jgi:hypothetical protein